MSRDARATNVIALATGKPYEPPPEPEPKRIGRAKRKFKQPVPGESAQSFLTFYKRLPRKRVSTFLYFVAGEFPIGRVVKIGFTSDPVKRMIAFYGIVPVPFELICLGLGTRQHEGALHAVFSNYRLRGEWFRLVPEIEDMANAISAMQDESDEFQALLSVVKAILDE